MADALTIGQLLALHAVVTESTVPGKRGLLDALDRLIDQYPRHQEEA